MNSYEGPQAYVAPDSSEWVLGQTEFGGFSPETEAGAELFRLLGESGTTGAWLAEQLTTEARKQAAISFGESVSRRYKPDLPHMGYQMILLATMIEHAAIANGDEARAEAARDDRVKDGDYQARNEGLHLMVFEAYVARAREQVRAQLN